MLNRDSSMIEIFRTGYERVGIACFASNWDANVSKRSLSTGLTTEMRLALLPPTPCKKNLQFSSINIGECGGG